MTAYDLPPWIVQTLAERLASTPREPLRRAQKHLSEIYRDGGHSNAAIRSEADALAYALVRMPATYAACAAAFAHAAEALPEFAPQTALDIGAGPGTAGYAATARWTALASVDQFEPHARMNDIARELAAADPHAHYRTCDADKIDSISTTYDLVVASYVLTEQDDRAAASLVDNALRLSSGVVVLVEPGTKRGYQRLMAARDRALAAGASIAAPCPSNGPCPLPADDWCHFKVRLNRRKEHRVVKDADAPFEDEPYAYLVITKTPHTRAANPARLLRPPLIGKAEAAVIMCTPTGLEKRTISRRNKAAYKAVKHWSAGDAVALDLTHVDTPEEPHR